MHIILDNQQVGDYKKKYTVLELDTFRVMPDENLVTAWCVVDTIPLMEINVLDNHTRLHSELIRNYRIKNWDFCEQAIEKLLGKWNGELDSFYADILNRVEKLKSQEPDQNWDGIINKPFS
jgi:hypothetical protein